MDVLPASTMSLTGASLLQQIRPRASEARHSNPLLRCKVAESTHTYLPSLQNYSSTARHSSKSSSISSVSCARPLLLTNNNSNMLMEIQMTEKNKESPATEAPPSLSIA
jgi:hypothetical protein